ncbi:MAG: sulfurtransferase [Pseudomonadota bacterium]
MAGPEFVAPSDVAASDAVVLDCRFSLADEGEGERSFLAGHIPGARYLHLNRDLSGPLGEHGGRHPMPNTALFAQTLAERGVGLDTPVILYDDSRYAFAARAWWMMRALGYRQPAFLEGGYASWLNQGGAPQAGELTAPALAAPSVREDWPLWCDREGLRALQAAGAQLIDAREAPRYRGEIEPIDPVAGHIPGADNVPWSDLFDGEGALLSPERLKALWGRHGEADPLVVYCGSGVTACVDLLALALIGREDAWLYGGSWSDWCSYLPRD